MKKQIIHKGRIVKVDGDTVTVAIAPTEEECHGCAISSMCRKSELLEVPMHDPSSDLVGKEVTLGISSGSQYWAILLFFVIPVLLLFGSLILGLSCFGMSDATSSILALAVIAIWYLGVFIWRKRFSSPIEVEVIE